MSGVVLAAVGVGGVAPGGSPAQTTPSPLSWTDIYGRDAGSTQLLTVQGITAPIQISATLTGAGILSYAVNGAFSPYQGGFTVRAGDTVMWTVVAPHSDTVSGTVTPVNATTGAPLGDFTYIIYSSRGVQP